MTGTEIRSVLARMVVKVGGQKTLATKMGVSQAYLSDILRGRRDPGPRVLAFLGLRRTYERVKP